jgi:hypothetical protein
MVIDLLGFPSVGKSTLMSKLTGTASEVGAYEFTTLTTVPGIIQYKGAKLQVRSNHLHRVFDSLIFEQFTIRFSIFLVLLKVPRMVKVEVAKLLLVSLLDSSSKRDQALIIVFSCTYLFTYFYCA